jgi:hypothetical protein
MPFPTHRTVAPLIIVMQSHLRVKLREVAGMVASLFETGSFSPVRGHNMSVLIEASCPA